MAHDVFISYSHHDKPQADAVCATLEAKGIRSWIAPRDVIPGQEWGAAIVHAIRSSRVMVLVFSSHANASPQIRREVERAVNAETVLIPFRIEDVLPTSSLEYFLGTPHWLDAVTPPLEAHLERLAAAVASFLAVIEPAAQTAGDVLSDESATPISTCGMPDEHEPAAAPQPPLTDIMEDEPLRTESTTRIVKPPERREIPSAGSETATGSRPGKPPTRPPTKPIRRVKSLAAASPIKLPKLPSWPEGVAVDVEANVYITVSHPRAQVLKLLAGAEQPVELPFTGVRFPRGVAVDSAGNVYVVDEQAGKVLELVAGASTPIVLPFDDLDGPEGVAVDAEGSVYVADSCNHRVLKLADGADTPTTLPFPGLDCPRRVAVDADGTVIVVVDVNDDGNARALKLMPGASTPIVLPFDDFAAWAGAAIDAEGSVYVTAGAEIWKVPAGEDDCEELLPHRGTIFAIGADFTGTLYLGVSEHGRTQARSVVSLGDA